MSDSNAMIKEEPDDRTFLKVAHFVPTNKVIKLTQNKGGGICIPLKSSVLKRNYVKRAKSGGFLKLVNHSTGQEVIVPTSPYLIENQTVGSLDTLQSNDLTELEDILRRNADHDTVERIREDAEVLQEEALLGYHLKKPVESLPGSAYLLLPSFFCVNHRTNLSFTSTATVMSSVNHAMLEEMKSPCLRLHHNPRVPPTIKRLFEEPPPEPKGPATDRFEIIMNFTKEFREKRLKYGITQFEVIDSLVKMYGLHWSQTTISRFEGLILGVKHTCKIMSILKRWLEDIEAALFREDCHANNAAGEDEEDNKLYRLVSVECSGRDRPLIVRIRSDMDCKFRKRKKRTLWSQDKIQVLENSFRKDRMPRKETIAELARTIDEPINTVRIWFCNRRAKYRRLKYCSEDNVDTSGILNIDASELTIVPQSSENA